MYSCYVINIYLNMLIITTLNTYKVTKNNIKKKNFVLSVIRFLEGYKTGFYLKKLSSGIRNLKYKKKKY